MNNQEINTELLQMLTDARLSARLQLLDALESKLDALEASNASTKQIITTLKAWATARQVTTLKVQTITHQLTAIKRNSI